MSSRKWHVLAVSIFTAQSLLFAADAHASIIISNTAGTSSLGGAGHLGHSFTMPNLAPYNNITWSWIASNKTTRLAAGDLFLLTQEYLGAPQDISPATPGYIAESVGILADAYTFHPTVTLNPSIQYWVYMGGDSELAGGAYSFGNPYAGGKAYETFSRPVFWNNGSDLDFNFVLSGTVVPEPASLALLLISTAALLRRKA